MGLFTISMRGTFGAFALFVLLIGQMPLLGARARYGEEEAALLSQMRSHLDHVRHEVRNHESEIRTYEEKFKSLEYGIEALRDQFLDATRAQKDSLKGSAGALESRMANIENFQKNIASDLKQFKVHANELAGVLTQHKEKYRELESYVEKQNQVIEHLQSALRSIMEALQIKDERSAGKTYRVANGDSLEKIAKKHQVSLKALKELNKLANDRIFVGQTLLIPESI